MFGGHYRNNTPPFPDLGKSHKINKVLHITTFILHVFAADTG